MAFYRLINPIIIDQKNIIKVNLPLCNSVWLFHKLQSQKSWPPLL